MMGTHHGATMRIDVDRDGPFLTGFAGRGIEIEAPEKFLSCGNSGISRERSSIIHKNRFFPYLMCGNYN
jgi:hypothetical protein